MISSDVSRDAPTIATHSPIPTKAIAPSSSLRSTRAARNVTGPYASAPPTEFAASISVSPCMSRPAIIPYTGPNPPIAPVIRPTRMHPAPPTGDARSITPRRGRNAFSRGGCASPPSTTGNDEAATAAAPSASAVQRVGSTTFRLNVPPSEASRLAIM